MDNSSESFNQFAKDYLYAELREASQSVLAKLEGLSEYDLRRPMTETGTNLLGLIKHLAIWQARYLGEVFGLPSLEPLAAWADAEGSGSSEPDALTSGADLWARAGETSDEIVALYRRVWEQSDRMVESLQIDSQGHVPWWPQPDVALLNVLVHLVAETSRHAGHMDILREQLDGTTEQSDDDRYGSEFWSERFAHIEQAAKSVR